MYLGDKNAKLQSSWLQPKSRTLLFNLLFQPEIKDKFHCVVFLMLNSLFLWSPKTSKEAFSNR